MWHGRPLSDEEYEVYETIYVGEHPDFDDEDNDEEDYEGDDEDDEEWDEEDDEEWGDEDDWDEDDGN